MANQDDLDREREAQAKFATTEAEEAFRERLDVLHAYFQEANQKFFHGKLVVPHIHLDGVPSRSLCQCQARTGNGGALKITLHKGILIEPKETWVLKDWPHGGLKNFVKDLSLRYFVRQYVLEVEKDTEEGYEGFGPRFTEHANRIGKMLELAEVIVRRRGPEDAKAMICSGWPVNVRAADHYQGAVTKALLDLATRGPDAGKRRACSHSLPVMRLLRTLMKDNSGEGVGVFLDRHLERLAKGSGRRPHRQAKAEKGEADVDGSPLGEVEIKPEWLAWNNGLVRQMAVTIWWFRGFAELPMLADALQAAGCTEGKLLRHLRAEIEHGQNCWVLKRLLAAGSAEDEPEEGTAKGGTRPSVVPQ